MIIIDVNNVTSQHRPHTRFVSPRSPLHSLPNRLYRIIETVSVWLVVLRVLVKLLASCLLDEAADGRVVVAGFVVVQPDDPIPPLAGEAVHQRSVPTPGPGLPEGIIPQPPAGVTLTSPSTPQASAQTWFISCPSPPKVGREKRKSPA